VALRTWPAISWNGARTCGPTPMASRRRTPAWFEVGTTRMARGTARATAGDTILPDRAAATRLGSDASPAGRRSRTCEASSNATFAGPGLPQGALLQGPRRRARETLSLIPSLSDAVTGCRGWGAPGTRSHACPLGPGHRTQVLPLQSPILRTGGREPGGTRGCRERRVPARDTSGRAHRLSLGVVCLVRPLAPRPARLRPLGRGCGRGNVRPACCPGRGSSPRCPGLALRGRFEPGQGRFTPRWHEESVTP